MNDTQKTLRAYILGFVFSAALTLTAFFLVEAHWTSGGAIFSRTFLTAAAISLAMVQLTVQLIFFLHLGKDAKPHWNTVTFITTFLLMLVVVLGSLWIINHLNYNMMLMTPDQIDTYMLGQG